MAPAASAQSSVGFTDTPEVALAGDGVAGTAGSVPATAVPVRVTSAAPPGRLAATTRSVAVLLPTVAGLKRTATMRSAPGASTVSPESLLMRNSPGWAPASSTLVIASSADTLRLMMMISLLALAPRLRLWVPNPWVAGKTCELVLRGLSRLLISVPALAPGPL